MLIEVLPGAAEGTIDRVESNLAAPSAGPSRLLAEGGLEALVAFALAGLEPETREQTDLDYRCGCSSERIGRYLDAMDEADREGLRRSDGTLEA